MEALNIERPRLVLVYQGQDISASIAPSLIDLVYTDCLEDKSDSVQIALEDADKRWQGAWYPRHGDLLSLDIGYANAPLLPCGEFEVDDVELSGPPNVVRIKALAAGVRRAVRTRNGKAYENTTLYAIAAQVANRNSLNFAGTAQALKIQVRRVTQLFETDLQFLRRLATEYGYAFSVRGKVLSLFKRSDLKAQGAVMVITPQDLTSYDFTDKITEVVSSARVHYHDPAARQGQKGQAMDTQVASADNLKIHTRVENEEQASLKAGAALERANEDQTTASLRLPGNTRMMAGISVLVRGFGEMSGKYLVHESRHQFSGSGGYTTAAELKRVSAS